MSSSLPVLPTISTACIVISAILVGFGVWQVKKGNIKVHEKLMFWAAVFAVVFFIIYASRTLFIGNTAFGGPESIKIYYTIFLISHITLATIGAIMGIISLYYGFKGKIEKHRKIAPPTSIIWMVNAVAGVTVYLLLYVIYEGGKTTSVFKAIIGS